MDYKKIVRYVIWSSILLSTACWINMDAKEKKNRRITCTVEKKVEREITTIGKVDIRKIEIKAGAKKKFKVLHISDSHFTYTDTRDGNNKDKTEMAIWRKYDFPFSEHYLDLLLEYARNNNLMIIHSGDMIDYVSELNLDHAAAVFNQGDWLVCPGNHEYAHVLIDVKADDAWRAKSLPLIQSAYPNDLTFYSRVINGINFVAIDNVLYKVTQEQWDLVKKEFEKGLPIILVCHIPFYQPGLYNKVMGDGKAKYACLCSVPRELTDTYYTNPKLPEDEQWKNPSVNQRAEDTTMAFTQWLKEQPLLKGILAGHLHEFHEERFSPTAMQYVVGTSSTGEAYEVTFK